MFEPLLPLCLKEAQVEVNPPPCDLGFSCIASVHADLVHRIFELKANGIELSALNV